MAEKVREIIETHKVSPLPDKTLAALQRLKLKGEKELMASAAKQSKAVEIYDEKELMMSTLNTISDALLSLDEPGVINNVKGAMDAGISAPDILQKSLIAAMDIIGERMETGSIFLPEVLKAAKIMKNAIEILKPSLSETDVKASGKVVMGTVKGDLHNIGKNLVSLPGKRRFRSLRSRYRCPAGDVCPGDQRP